MYRQAYKNKPCLLDFVKANIADSSIIQFAGKTSNYAKFDQDYCDESKAIYINEQGTGKESVTIVKSEFIMSKHEFDYDTIVFEGYDFTSIVPVSIEGHPFLGIQVHPGLNKGVVEEQNVISELKIEWNQRKISISLEEHFLLFNANFCKESEYGLVKPIEIFDIGNNKIAIYVHGNPRYTNNIQGDYIAKVIVDKNEGYVGTIFMHDHDLEAYGWRRCRDFQGF
jgi:hypothetical protein